MTKKTNLRNILLIALLVITSVYAFFHLSGYGIGSKYNTNKAIDSRQTLLDEVDAERAKQEADELNKIQEAIDQTDLGTLPQ